MADALKALQARDRSRYVDAIKTLGEDGDQSAIEPLVEIMMTDGGALPGLAAVALDTLDHRGYPVAPELLLDALVRVQPGQWLSQFDFPSLSPVKRQHNLTRAELSNKRFLKLDELVLGKIVQLLVANMDRRLIPRLVELTCFTMTGRSTGGPSLEHVERMQNVGYRVLESMDDAAAVDALANEVRARPFSPKPRKALCNAVHPHAVDVLLEFLADPPMLSSSTAQDRSAARWDYELALGRWRDPRALTPLLARLDSGTGGVVGLKAFGGPAVESALIDRLDAPDIDVALRAVEVLHKIGGRTAVGPLLRFLDAHDWTGSGLVLETLGRIGDPSATQTLCAKLSPITPDNAELIDGIARALAQIGDPTALPALQRIDPGPVSNAEVDLAKDNRIYSEQHLGIYRCVATGKTVHDAVVALQSARKR